MGTGGEKKPPRGVRITLQSLTPLLSDRQCTLPSALATTIWLGFVNSVGAPNIGPKLSTDQSLLPVKKSDINLFTFRTICFGFSTLIYRC